MSVRPLVLRCAVEQRCWLNVVALGVPGLMVSPVTQAQAVAASPSGVAAVAHTYEPPSAVMVSTPLAGERSPTSTNVGRLVSLAPFGLSVTVASWPVVSWL